MVRLMLTLTPVVCVLAAIAFSKTFEIYLKDDAPKSSGKEASEEPAESKNDRLYDKVRGRKLIHMMMFFETFLNWLLKVY